MGTTQSEGWLRLTGGDTRQHFFRDGMSVCGKYVSPITSFPVDDGPDAGECAACRSVVDVDEHRTPSY
ncbi:hypothetical protein [Cellulomonas sp. URHB0016]